MINGVTSRITNIGVIVIVMVCIVGVILLGLQEKEVPAEIAATLTAGVGFLAGTKFTPIDGSHKKMPMGDE